MSKKKAATAKSPSRAKKPPPAKKTKPAARAQSEISKGADTQVPPKSPDPAPEDQAREAAEWDALEAEAAADAQRPPSTPAPMAAARAGAVDQANQYPKDPQVEQAINQLLTVSFSAFAPNWGVRQEEIDAAADAYARSIEDIFPGGAAALGPHFASLLMTLAIFGPRLAMRTPPRLEDKPKEQGGQGQAETPAADSEAGLEETVPE